MKYSGPIRRDPLSRPPRRWSPIILTLLCAGGMAIIYWLGASKIVSDHALTLAIVVAVPVASFILAGDGARVLFRRSSDRNGPPYLQPTDLPPIDQKIGPVAPFDEGLRLHRHTRRATTSSRRNRRGEC